MRTYVPQKVQMVVANQILTGFAKGSFIVVEKAEDDFTKDIGSDGEVARTQSADESGTVTITLMQTSASNDILSTLRDTDKLSSNDPFPILMKDGSGRTLVTAAEAWIKKVPNSDMADQAKERVWILESGILLHHVGGN